MCVCVWGGGGGGGARMCACLSVSLILRPSEEEEEKESGTHCLRMRQVSLISCILFVSLRYMDSYVTCGADTWILM